ncbi:MAG: helix-turn-helix domain-containing protein [Janthinobacterium lividum]
MRFITLSPADEIRLTQLYATSSNKVVRRRSQCLLLSHKGHTISQVTAIFSVCRITIYQWFDRWQDVALSGLSHTPGQGRKSKLAALAQPVVEKLVEQHPQNLNAVVSDLATQHAVACSKDTLRRRLKKVAVAV